MKVLMVLRDPLPPTRVDVGVLFDRELRQLGIATDYVGSAPEPVSEASCSGRMILVPARTHPLSWLIEAVQVWHRLPRYDLLVVRDKPLSALWLYPIAALRSRPVAFWMSFPIPLGDRVAAAMHWRSRRWGRAILVGWRGWIGELVQRRLTLRGARHVFAQSAAMRTLLLRTSGLDPRRVSAVPMGVDTTVSSIANDPDQGVEPLESGGPWIVYVGTLEFARRLDVLLDAFAMVHQRRPEARLAMIGGATRRQDEQQLHDRAAALGLGAAVRFTGMLPMRQALQLARSASLAVSPIPPGPLFDVSSPTKVVEYLALGLPVVATDIPDQRDLLERFGGGRCVGFDAPSLAHAMLEVLGTLAESRRAARRAGERMLAERSYPVIAERVHHTLKGLVAPPSPGVRRVTP